ncbi:MAG: helix-turn-helix domain-containing protein [Treponema sp.]|nr:helix-turn-helix domain-containing protein [Treponema sp.]
MSTVYADELFNETSIVSRREIEPLLAKARQMLNFYDEAMDCPAIVMNRAGQAITGFEHKRQLRFCELCKKYWNNPTAIWEGYKYPCEAVHNEALAESRRISGTYIYSCPAGFVCWTSPLFRNGRYAGALKAGHVLSSSHEEVLGKFLALSKDKIATDKFRKLLEGTEQKSLEEVQAMARLLGVCAEEISEKNKGAGPIIRRIGLKDMNTTKPKLPATDTEPEQLLEKERMLVAAFKRGDSETGGKILNELMSRFKASFQEDSPEDFEIIRLRAIELLVLLSRAAIPASSEAASGDTLLDGNDRYLRRIQESKNPEELIENLQLAAKSMAGKIFSFQGIRHASVLRKAERYIWENYTRKISLTEISKASGLSAPYLSTIFKEEMGENLSSYLNRLRVERAKTLLKETSKPLKEIAKLCGFEDQSWFSKIFKTFTGTSPGKYRGAL